MLGIHENLIKTINSVEETTNLFYQQNLEEGYKNLDETLCVLSKTVDEIFAYKANGNEIGIDENKLVSVLTEAMNAIEEKDTVLLSDILQYELKELLEKVLSVI